MASSSSRKNALFAASGAMFVVLLIILLVATSVQRDVLSHGIQKRVIEQRWEAPAVHDGNGSHVAGSSDAPRLNLTIKANPSRSYINGLQIDPAECFIDESHLSVLFAGHTYGGQPPGSKLYPSRNLMTTLQSIVTETHPCAVILLGDTIRTVWNEPSVALFDWFAKKFPLPIFVAPGNHDSIVYGPGRFFDRPLFYEVVVSDHTKVLVCNGDVTTVNIQPERTEIREDLMGVLSGEQLFFLRQQLETSPQEMIVIAFHRCVWAEYFPVLWQNVNSRINYRAGGWKKAEQIIQSARQKGKQIVVTGGDIGMYATLSVFYGEHNGVKYIASGMADWALDTVLSLNIDELNLEYRFRVLSSAPSLRGQQLRPIQHYNETLWTRYFRKLNDYKMRKERWPAAERATFFHLE